jgi:hypothetical protein
VQFADQFANAVACGCANIAEMCDLWKRGLEFVAWQIGVKDLLIEYRTRFEST